MKRRTRLLALLAGVSAAAGTALVNCQDYSPGLGLEPEGPLLVTRLTLLTVILAPFDPTTRPSLRDAAVFTDTSAPSDCSVPALKDTPTCYGDIFKDAYGVLKSPPNPDSGTMMRVVFNKVPLKINGKDLEKVTQQPMKPPTSLDLTDMTAVGLSCSECSGAPPLLETLQLSGSTLSPTPTDPRFAYGPALQMQVQAPLMNPDNTVVKDKDGNPVPDPLVALEPDTSYVVTVNPGLADRDGNKLSLDPNTSLLRFKTEPFQVLQVGVGDDGSVTAPDKDPGDPWVYTDPKKYGAGTAQAPYTIDSVPSDGVVRLKLNAAVDEGSFKAATATATVDGKAVAVKVGIAVDSMGACDRSNHRSVYVFPDAMDPNKRSWGQKGQKLVVTVTGADIRDVSPVATMGVHPAGRHTLKADVVVNATLGDKADPKTFLGPLASAVRAPADCPDQRGNPDGGSADMPTDGPTDAKPNG